MLKDFNALPRNYCLEKIGRELIKMQCRRCGKELKNSSRCSFCGFENSEEGNVREMTQIEKKFYDGVTIEEDGTENNYSNSRRENFRTRATYIKIDSGGFFSRLFEKFIQSLMNNSLIAKIIAGLIFIAFAGILFFVALPIMFFMIALGVALFFYARFRGKI